MSKSVATLAALTAFVSFAVAAQGGNLGFLKNAPIGSLNEEDLELLQEAAAAVLKSTEDGVTRTWQNAATGNSGTIKSLSRFNTEDRRECRRLLIQNHTKRAGDGTSTMNVCRASGGRWLMDPDAQPAPSGE
jgi:surface antigen